jgi:hypothetical protein
MHGWWHPAPGWSNSVAVVLLFGGMLEACGSTRNTPLTLSRLSASMPSESLMPPNLVARGTLRSLVLTMLQQSPTFRRQCARLAERQDLVIHMDLVRQIPQHHARMRFEHHAGARRSVIEIGLREPARFVEQIAHELEHVLEYLDHVDLQRFARQRVDGVIDLGHVYETARARSVGRTVAREVIAR